MHRSNSRRLGRLWLPAALSILVAVLALTFTVSAEIEPWRAEIGAPPIGAPAKHPSTVAGGFVIESPPWMVSGFCGGTLVAPQWVLSAHHCGDRTGQLYLIGGIEYRIVAQYFPWTTAPYEQLTPDLALWKLDYPSSMQTLPMATQVDWDDPGDWVYGIGYGDLGPNAPSDLQLRSTGWIQVDNDLGWQFEYGEPGVTTCFGDSGGPVIGDANPPNAQLVLVGVTSYTVTGPGGDCTNLAGAAKVADQLGWINGVIAANGGPGVYVPPVPTPTPTVTPTPTPTPVQGVPTMLGDVTCNNKLTSLDARWILQFLVGLRSASGTCPLLPADVELNIVNGDMNDDFETDVADALILATCLVSSVDPVCEVIGDN